tara:strand:- start:6313 stop:7185 length:873 start_codon:yes stop_codon:yes gene_type:complete
MVNITNIINLPTKVGESKILEPDECTSEDYHLRKKWIGSTEWKLWATKTPKEAKHGIKIKNQLALDIGSAFHLLLENEELFKRNIFFTDAHGSSNEIKVWKENKKKGQYIFKTNLEKKLYNMRDSLYEHKLADTYLHHESSKKEWSYFIFGKDFKEKIRCDLTRVGIKDPNKDIIIDYKTTASVTPKNFARSIKDFGYHIQVAHYMNIYKKVTGREIEDFVFVCVEKEEPYLTAFYTLNEQTLAEGQAALAEAKRKYTYAHNMQDFSGLPETKLEIGLNHWDYEYVIDNT